MDSIKERRIGQKSAWILSIESDHATVKALRSYRTIVAVASGSTGFISNSYYYGGKSHTTGRHISCFTREYPGVKWQEVNHGEFNQKFRELTA